MKSCAVGGAISAPLVTLSSLFYSLDQWKVKDFGVEVDYDAQGASRQETANHGA